MTKKIECLRVFAVLGGVLVAAALGGAPSIQAAEKTSHSMGDIPHILEPREVADSAGADFLSPRFEAPAWPTRRILPWNR